MARVPNVVQTEQSFRPIAAAARKLALGGRVCVNCGASEIRPSNRRNALDIVLACLFLAPFRCRVCRIRFYLFWRPSLQRLPEPPIAPLLLMAPRRTFPNVYSIAPHIIDPEPVRVPRNEPQLVPLSPQDVAQVEVVPPALPAVVEPETSRRPAIACPPGSILILENDLSIRKLLRRLLERRGYSTVEIARSEDLDGELNGRPVDLLIVDVSAAAASALAGAYPNLKILALSTESLADIPGRLLALPKPFPLDSFVDSVDRLLGP
jgi:hypothetical protein